MTLCYFSYFAIGNENEFVHQTDDYIVTNSTIAYTLGEKTFDITTDASVLREYCASLEIDGITEWSLKEKAVKDEVTSKWLNLKATTSIDGKKTLLFDYNGNNQKIVVTLDNDKAPRNFTQKYSGYGSAVCKTGNAKKTFIDKQINLLDNNEPLPELNEHLSLLRLGDFYLGSRYRDIVPPEVVARTEKFVPSDVINEIYQYRYQVENFTSPRLRLINDYLTVLNDSKHSDLPSWQALKSLEPEIRERLAALDSGKTINCDISSTFKLCEKFDLEIPGITLSHLSASIMWNGIVNNVFANYTFDNTQFSYSDLQKNFNMKYTNFIQGRSYAFVRFTSGGGADKFQVRMSINKPAEFTKQKHIEEIENRLEFVSSLNLEALMNELEDEKKSIQTKSSNVF